MDNGIKYIETEQVDESNLYLIPPFIEFPPVILNFDTQVNSNSSLLIQNMKKLIYLFLLPLLACQHGKEQQTNVPLVYPETKRVDHVDDYFGTRVADPFRWLEDENAPETARWIETQNNFTFDYLAGIPFRDKIRERLTEVWNYERYSTPFKKGNHYFFYKNNGMQNQSVLYYQEDLESEALVLIDPNTFSEEGTTSLTNFTVSNNGKYAAYGISHAGSDWKEFFVMNLETGEKLTDHLKNIKFSGIAWEGNGFYYTRYDITDDNKLLSGKNEFTKVYYHRIGEEQKDDVLIFENREDPGKSYYAGVTEDEKIVFLSERESTSGNALYFKHAGSRQDFIQLTEGFEHDYRVIDHHEGKLIVYTNDNAPRYRLVSINLQNPHRDNWKEVIPEKEEVLRGVTMAGNNIVANYLKDVSSRLQAYSMEGELEREIELPGLGIVNEFKGNKDESPVFYSFATFTSPPVIFRHDLATNKTEVFREPAINFNSGEYETRQVFYPGKDGTMIPMFLVHKKGIQKDGNNPLLLHGYGGFNISSTPSFKVENTVFLENGGIYAVANIRGGGEYGKEWHRAGIQQNKQNVFDDFIAAAEYLVDNRYTNPSKLAVSGRSNGGLLVGAVMTQRPDLFKVALPAVGVMDMLRYHTFTIGYLWATDYGRSDDEAHFRNLLSYSPLHNIKEAEYPATFVTTADHDDRVVPAHSFKFISELQSKQKGNNPVLIRIDVNAGHGAGKPESKKIEEATDTWTFVFRQLGMSY